MKKYYVTMEQVEAAITKHCDGGKDCASDCPFCQIYGDLDEVCEEMDDDQ